MGVPTVRIFGPEGCCLGSACLNITSWLPESGWCTDLTSSYILSCPLVAVEYRVRTGTDMKERSDRILFLQGSTSIGPTQAPEPRRVPIHKTCIPKTRPVTVQQRKQPDPSIVHSKELSALSHSDLAGSSGLVLRAGWELSGTGMNMICSFRTSYARPALVTAFVAGPRSRKA